MMKLLISQCLFFLILLQGFSQEMLVPLDVNPLLSAGNTGSKKAWKSASPAVSDTLPLPFIDDFTGSGVYPDPSRWSDRHAYINSNLAMNFPSLGVATLDVLDESGKIHSHASEIQFLSEYLTSCPVNLELSPSDSIYLSFYYQPGGRVNEPETKDSLVLEFWSPVTGKWHSVWKKAGFRSEEFHQVMIPVVNPAFLKKGFRFRFKNYASLTVVDGLPDMTGNQDYWHLDYIYLNKNRTRNDTVRKDVAFVLPIRSLLVSYEAMPWDHFQAARLVEMGSKLGITYRNNGDLITLVTRNFQIRDLRSGALVHSYSGGSDNIDPFQTFFYNSNIIYTFSSPYTDTAVFEVKSHLITDIGDYKVNDTARYRQKFINYYAYDDGTAEKGYGLNGEGTSNARLALKFKTYKPDSLQAVSMFFCRTYEDASRHEFTLTVWNDNNGQPGDILYQQKGVLPSYESGLNRFLTYRLDNPFVVSGTFYVGWIQTTDKSLFLGFDIDRISNNKAFYFLPQVGTWLNSEFPGSLMIRPVMGSSLLLSDKQTPSGPGLRIYPNPANHTVRIDYPVNPGLTDFRLLLFDSMGILRRDITTPVEQINVSDLSPGVYLLLVRYGGMEMNKKLVISR